MLVFAEYSLCIPVYTGVQYTNLLTYLLIYWWLC